MNCYISLVEEKEQSFYANRIRYKFYKIFYKNNYYYININSNKITIHKYSSEIQNLNLIKRWGKVNLEEGIINLLENSSLEEDRILFLELLKIKLNDI